MNSSIITQTGLGLRFQYLDLLLEERPSSIHWLELLADHFHQCPPSLFRKIEALLAVYPCVLHGVNLSLGSSAPLNPAYLDLLDSLIMRFQPAWISDHLCVSDFPSSGNSHETIFFHDLLPLAFTEQNLDRIAFKIDFLQQKFKIPFLIENISSYLRFLDSTMTEAAFMRRLIEKTGCSILLDLNNVIVTCHNHGELVSDFLSEIPLSSVKQMHLAGFEQQGDLLIDTHSRTVSRAVFSLFKKLQKKTGPIPTCLEWDNDLPHFDLILKEVQRIEAAFTPPI